MAFDGFTPYDKDASELYSRRSELVGGGLVRSLGGWEEVKKMHTRGQDHIEGDQRIFYLFSKFTKQSYNME